MKDTDLLNHVCDAIRALPNADIDETGKGFIDFQGHKIYIEVKCDNEKKIFAIDLHFGISSIMDYVQPEIFMGLYNDNSTVTHLVGSAEPELRLSQCFDEDLPRKEFILKLLENALEVWAVLLPGFDRIQSEELLLDPDMASEGFDAMSFYKEITGNKLERPGLIY